MARRFSQFLAHAASLMRELSRAQFKRTAGSLLYLRNIDRRAQGTYLEVSYSVARCKRLYLQGLSPLGLLRLNPYQCGGQNGIKKRGQFARALYGRSRKLLLRLNRASTHP